MAVPKQKFREIVLQLLYSNDIAAMEVDQVNAIMMETLKVTKKVIREAYARMQLILEKKEEIDGMIQAVSHAYAIDRIQKLELNVIRLGAFELLFDDEIPPKVAIAEAMRLAQKFSTPESASFVNALLDAFYKKCEGIAVDVSQIDAEVKKLEESQKIAEEAALHTDKIADS